MIETIIALMKQVAIVITQYTVSQTVIQKGDILDGGDQIGHLCHISQNISQTMKIGQGRVEAGQIPVNPTEVLSVKVDI